MDTSSTAPVLASIPRRACALIIDTILLSIVSMACNVMIFTISGFSFDNALNDGTQSDDTFNVQTLFVITFVVHTLLILAIAWFLAKSRWHATPGKRLLGIYVGNKNNQPISFAQAVLRTMFPIYISFIYSTINSMYFIEQANYLYDNEFIIFEYLPQLEQEMIDPTMSIVQFLQTEDGMAHYKEAFEQLTADEQNQFREEMVKHNQLMFENSKIILIMHVVFLVFIMAWYLYALFNVERMAVHDRIANTRVFLGKLN